MLQNRCPQKSRGLELTKVEIDLGRGSCALNRWWKLHQVLAIGKRALRKMGNSDSARIIYDWQLTTRWLVLEAPHWTLELDGAEWQALSRALRHSGTAGRSMLAWINAHKVGSYE